MQADLYLQSEEPQHMQNLKARISEHKIAAEQHKNKPSAANSSQIAPLIRNQENLSDAAISGVTFPSQV